MDRMTDTVQNMTTIIRRDDDISLFSFAQDVTPDVESFHF